MSKQVAVADTNSKDIKAALKSRSDIPACLAVGWILAERVRETDVYTASYTLRERDKFEGNIRAVVQSLMDNGENPFGLVVVFCRSLINETKEHEAAKMVRPSSRREGFSVIPNVKWEDVGGLHLLRQEFDRYILGGFGVDLETGFLLYGPPGCGKTLSAKAVANEAGANFIHIKGELAVRTIFSRARTCALCILFFDVVDALTTKRGKEGGWVVEQLLNQQLIELDGADQRRGVYVMGATNRPEVMDRAVLRLGRFGKLLYVPLPSPDECGLILKALARKKPIDASVDLIAIGSDEACKNLSGADLSALMNEAAMAALEEKLTAQSSSDADHPTSLTIKKTHFEQALKKISPSVSDKQKHYQPSFVRKLQSGMRVDGVGVFGLIGIRFHCRCRCHHSFQVGGYSFNLWYRRGKTAAQLGKNQVSFTMINCDRLVLTKVVLWF
ncbi:hypothetical protein LOK49_LG06G00884 [Camellia lanceoleosa]|uniref:Uncharacterized protein n=1 Tax=Camellia lanceoleosa TaxID=1840588 RepID=A0ACC0HDM7_9ERIC|nr:hypothetical protein LOK49_LG06G00884 [Camellia lanceoleosa]